MTPKSLSAPQKQDNCWPSCLPNTVMTNQQWSSVARRNISCVVTTTCSTQTSQNKQGSAQGSQPDGHVHQAARVDLAEHISVG
mmetsp:Transcript_23/g.62  ORF Transcript_23/g.62 Transcript_23/m.62 type:complete len:83 (+) Transcript_23:129-377(+)|eukprot:scaffold222582_cov28-Tisochrysis_lutea.AAC.1